MCRVKKRPGGKKPFEHPEVCGVTLLSFSCNQRKADESHLSGHLYSLFQIMLNKSDFSLPQFLVSV